MAQFPISPKAAGRAAGSPTLLAWTQSDIENRFGFKGGRYTNVNHVFAFFVGVLLVGLFYGLAVFVLKRLPVADTMANMILRPSNQFTMIPATLFFFGGAVVLFLKSRKVQFQQRALNLSAVPAEPEFVLTEATAATVLARIHSLVDHPRHFVLLNRIDRALSNLKNIGQVNDVSSILRAQAENDEDQVASSYTLLNGLVWAIPVLGFIGTVQGLSMAIGQFTLIYALILQLWITFQQKREMTFLDECNDYCHSHVVAKLRLIDRQQPAVAPTAPDAKP
jgi:hypothetical protein